MKLTITGATVVDGTGGPVRHADLTVADGVITSCVDRPVPAPVMIIDTGAQRLELTGELVITPGFIDIHTHSDLTLLSAPQAPSAIRQGITTAVVGNCGLGVFPNPTDAGEHRLLRQAVAYTDVDPAVAWTWSDFDGYADTLSTARPALNVAVLTGHLPVHVAVAGHARATGAAGGPTAAQLTRMQQLLDQTLCAGSVGLSTGLVYPPLTQVSEDELVALAEVVAAHDAVFAWHMADYSDHLLDALDQVIRVARRTGVRTQVSHLVANGERNHHLFAAALERLTHARADGLDVAADVYPYTAGNCPLSQLLPAWVSDAGLDAATGHLTDPRRRPEIAAALEAYPVPWTMIDISRVPAPDVDLVGLTVAVAAARRGRPATELVLDLLATHLHEIIVTIHGRHVDHVRQLFAHDGGLVASDGLALDPDGPTGVGSPHPRSYGCFPRLLADFTGPDGLTLEAAVHKATGYPAARVGLTDRGTIAAGQAADLVILDTDRIADRADYAHPAVFPDGIVTVIVNGEIAVGPDGPTGARPGAVLRRAVPPADRPEPSGE